MVDKTDYTVGASLFEACHSMILTLNVEYLEKFNR
jgi:hypothetical protein